MKNYCVVLISLLFPILCNAQGNSVSNNKTKFDDASVSSLKKSAEQGDAEAQFELGEMYYNGYDVAQDYKQAFSWYKKSAEQGYAYAQLQLGGMYFNGKGVAKDDKQSSYWYNKAADHEDESAVQFLIAKMYYNGYDAVQDYKKAFYLFKKFAEEGLP